MRSPPNIMSWILAREYTHMVAQLIPHNGQTRWRTSDDLFYILRNDPTEPGTWLIIYDPYPRMKLPYTWRQRRKIYVRWKRSSKRTATLADVRKDIADYYEKPMSLYRENYHAITGWSAKVVRDESGWYVTGQSRYITKHNDAQNDFDLLSSERFKTRLAALDAFNGWEAMWHDVA